MRNGRTVEAELEAAMRQFIRSLDPKAKPASAEIRVVWSGFGTYDIFVTHPAFGRVNLAARQDRVWAFLMKALSKRALEQAGIVSMATQEEIEAARAIGAIGAAAREEAALR